MRRHVMLLLLSCLCLWFWQHLAQQQTALVLVNQTNVAMRYPLNTNRVQCQNVTDKAGRPLLQAADDMMWRVPPDSQCDALLFSFTTLRTRQDQNPSSITLQLLRHNGTSGGPSLPFFQITRQWPDNNAHWLYDAMGVPQQTDLLLQRGDTSELNGARFDPHDTQLLPRGSTVWVSVWATVPFHLAQAGYRANGFYWATLDNQTQSPIAPQNRPFWYRDSSDMLGYGWREWTPAQQVEPWLGIQLATQQLAWRVSLRCVVATPSPTGQPTLQPTSQPTSVPTPVPTVTTPTVTGVPTGPTTVPTRDPSTASLNQTQVPHSQFNTAALAVPLSLAGALTLCLAIGCVLRRRGLAKPDSLRDILSKPRPARTPQVAHAPNPLYGEGSRDGTMRVYTSGHELVSVSLSDVDGETRDAYREIFNDRVVMTEDEPDDGNDFGLAFADRL